MVSVILVTQNEDTEARVRKLESALLLLAQRTGFITNWLEFTHGAHQADVKNARLYAFDALKELSNGTGQSDQFRGRVEKALSEVEKALLRVS